MSLINEALKRAEAEKSGRSLPAAERPAVSPAGADAAPKQAKGTRRRMSLLLPVLLCVLIPAGGFLAFRMLDARGKASPQPAAAEGVGAAPATPARLAAPAPKPRIAISRETELAFARTMEAIKYYAPRARPAAAETAAESQPASRPAEPAGAPPVATTQKARPPSAPAVAAPKPKPAPVIDESKYKLTGILRHSDGAVAVINGSVVQVGQTLGEAKIVEIGRLSVDLEIDGRRFTIRM